MVKQKSRDVVCKIQKNDFALITHQNRKLPLSAQACEGQGSSSSSSGSKGPKGKGKGK